MYAYITCVYVLYSEYKSQLWCAKINLRIEMIEVIRITSNKSSENKCAQKINKK